MFYLQDGNAFPFPWCPGRGSNQLKQACWVILHLRGKLSSTLSFSALCMATSYFPLNSGNDRLCPLHYQPLSHGMVSILPFYGREDSDLDGSRWPFQFYSQFYQAFIDLQTPVVRVKWVCCRKQTINGQLAMKQFPLFNYTNKTIFQVMQREENEHINCMNQKIANLYQSGSGKAYTI